MSMRRAGIDPGRGEGSGVSGVKPVVLVNSDARPIDGYDGSVCATTYLAAVLEGADALPVQLPAMAGLDPVPYLDAADGVLLTGSRSNVHPAAYGGRADAEAEPFDTVRDSIDIPLVRAALERGVPLLAICRGFQELNVALGGTLHVAVHALPGRMDHRFPPDAPTLDEKFRLAHEVAVEPGGRLASIVRAERFRVNSLHRQGIDRLAEGLVVEARADDGTIEAARVDEAPAFALGVQWHPEYWFRSDPPSRAILAAFGRAVRHRRARRRDAVPQDIGLVS